MEDIAETANWFNDSLAMDWKISDCNTIGAGDEKRILQGGWIIQKTNKL